MSDLLEIIGQFKDEPLALVVVGSLIILKILELFIKNIPWLYSKIFKKRDGVPLENKSWQDFVIEKIKEIETKIERLFNIMSEHEYLLDKTSEGTLENQLFSKERNVFLRLKAFRRLLAMGKNGRVWKCGFELIVQNKEVWLDVLETDLGIKIVDLEYYNKRIEEIRTRIFDGFA